MSEKRRSVEILKEEHEVIKRALDVLEKIADGAEKDGKIPSEDAKKVLEFLSVFADRCHHAKEEDILFPLLAERGIPVEGGPIGVMLQEHEIMRDMRARMSEAVEKSDAKAFSGIAKEFLQMLREHIFKEDNVLFQMACDVMSEEDDRKLVEEYERAEREKIGEGVHEKFIRLVEELEGRWR